MLRRRYHFVSLSLTLGMALVADPAFARVRTSGAVSPECNVSMPCDLSGSRRPVPERLAAVGKERRSDRHNRSRSGVDRTNRGAESHGNFASFGPSLGSAVGKPSRYVAGRLICAINVGVALAERGIRGTGSALAMSYRTWGRSAGGPVPGAVIVSARRGGGHVAIVSRVENGVVYAWNATGGQRGWREVPYRHRVTDYRLPS